MRDLEASAGCSIISSRDSRSVPRLATGVRREQPGVTIASLYVRSGDGFAEAPAQVVLENARLLLAEAFRPGAPVLRSPELVETFLAAQLSAREHEVFALILLDGAFRLIEYVELFNGTHNEARVHVREVAKVALRRSAVRVILVHNHPTGDSTPSHGDMALTRSIKKALDLVDIEVIDHIVVGATVTSFVRSGLPI